MQQPSTDIIDNLRQTQNHFYQHLNKSKNIKGLFNLIKYLF